MKTARSRLVPGLTLVRTRSGPGKRPDTTAAAAIAPTIWVIATSAPRIQGTAPMRHKPSVT
jgi:hypothetical protein